MNFYMPVRLFTGEGCVEKNLASQLPEGRSCLVVTGAHSAEACGALGDVSAVLNKEGISFSVFNGISANPRVSDCIRAGRAAADIGARFIIGIGGGSAMDAAKAVSVFAANPGMDEERFYSGVWSNSPLPLILVGTTAGTGSEVTKVSVLTDSKGRKHSIHHDLLYSRASYGDSAYTLSLPRKVTLSTGIDVLAHCTESYFSKKATPLSRACSVEGIKMLLTPLAAAVNGNELSPTQRATLYDASIMGGLAISVTGTCFPHNVGYYLTESFGIPHGFASAAFLPELLEHVKKAAPEYAESFFSSVGRTAEELTELTEMVVPKLELNIGREELDNILPRWENNNSVKNTVGNVAVSDIRSYLEKYVK